MEWVPTGLKISVSYKYMDMCAPFFLPLSPVNYPSISVCEYTPGTHITIPMEYWHHYALEPGHFPFEENRSWCLFEDIEACFTPYLFGYSNIILMILSWGFRGFSPPSNIMQNYGITSTHLICKLLRCVFCIRYPCGLCSTHVRALILPSGWGDPSKGDSSPV